MYLLQTHENCNALIVHSNALHHIHVYLILGTVQNHSRGAFWKKGGEAKCPPPPVQNSICSNEAEIAKSQLILGLLLLTKQYVLYQLITCIMIPTVNQLQFRSKLIQNYLRFPGSSPSLNEASQEYGNAVGIL